MSGRVDESRKTASPGMAAEIAASRAAGRRFASRAELDGRKRRMFLLSLWRDADTEDDARDPEDLHHK